MKERTPTPQERKHRYRLAMRAFEGKDYSAAARAFADIASADDLGGVVSRYYAGEAYLRLGLELMQQSDFQAAARSFEQATEFNPHSRTLPQYLACCFAKLHRFDQAVRYSDREVSLRWNESEPRVRLSLSLWRDGQQDAAIQTLREGIITQPQQVDWHFQLGVFLAGREEHEGAIEPLTRAIELDPGHADALMHIGLCHGAKQEPAEAVRYLSLAQQKRPNDAKIGMFLAMASHAASTSDLAQNLRLASPVATPAVGLADIEELTQLVTHEPEVVEAFVSLPQVETDHNVFELLAAVIDRAVLKMPRSAELRYHQARIYCRLGRRELAIASCERAIEINPRLVQALITLARLYLETERWEDARTRLQQVLDLGYEYADVYFHLGCIYRDQGEHQRARESYHRALAINAGYQAAREALESLAA